MIPEQIIRRPIILTEKATLLREKHNQVIFEVARTRNKVADQARRAEAVQGERDQRQHDDRPRQGPPHGHAATLRRRTGRRQS